MITSNKERFSGRVILGISRGGATDKETTSITIPPEIGTNVVGAFRKYSLLACVNETHASGEFSGRFFLISYQEVGDLLAKDPAALSDEERQRLDVILSVEKKVMANRAGTKAHQFLRSLGLRRSPSSSGNEAGDV